MIIKFIKCKISQISICISLTLILAGCGKLINVEEDCRDFSFQGEEYWFPENIDSNVIFKDSDNNEKVFKVIKKKSTHVSKYFTDTGCGCNDYSNMILTSDTDTIYLKRLSKYIYDNEAETIEDIVFMFNRDHSIFFETALIGFENITINNIQVNNCRVYERDYSQGRRINKVIFAKGIGIVRYIMQDGKFWTNSSLVITEENKLDSFNYTENICE